MSSESMTAAVLNSPGDLEITEVDVPEPGNGEVLVRVRACGVCGTDLEIRDEGWEGAEFPFIMGHEWTGEVAELGPETSTQFEIGDRVASEPHDGCGFCRNCKVGKYTACLNYGDFSKGHKHYGFTVDGGYAHYCTIPEKNLHHLPESLDYVEGTLITTAACSLYAVEKPQVAAGDFVTVLGPGAIGLLAAECAKFRGASEVLVTGTRDSRLSVAEEMGFHTVNINKQDPLEVVNRMTDGVGADVVIEAAGAFPAQTQAVEMVRRGGNLALVGNPGEGLAEINTQWLVSGDINTYGVKAEGMNSTERVTRLMAHRNFNTDPLITHQYELNELHEAMETFENREGGAIKVVVTM